MFDVTKVSSKGQIVIPKPIRESLKLMEGDKLIAYARGDLIIFRKVKEEESILSLMSRPTRTKIAEREVTRGDVDEAVEWARERP